MRQTVVMSALAGFLLTGCSLLGLYGPPLSGPPSAGDGPTTFTLYNSHGQRVGTVRAAPR